jgi:hypothetical protein
MDIGICCPLPHTCDWLKIEDLEHINRIQQKRNTTRLMCDPINDYV